MTEREKWPVGTKVMFDWDGLKSLGTIILNNDYTCIVLLPEDARPRDDGWIITTEADGAHSGRRGWNVPYSELKPATTALGNKLIFI